MALSRGLTAHQHTSTSDGGANIAPVTFTAPNLSITSAALAALAVIAGKINAGAIVNADVSASAAIAIGKLKIFESSELAMMSGAATVTAAHGLGAVPKYVIAVYRCKSDDNGYTAGYEIPWSSHISSAPAPLGNIAADATNIGYIVAVTNPTIWNFSTQAQVSISGSANWKIVFYAIA